MIQCLLTELQSQAIQMIYSSPPPLNDRKKARFGSSANSGAGGGYFSFYSVQDCKSGRMEKSLALGEDVLTSSQMFSHPALPFYSVNK